MNLLKAIILDTEDGEIEVSTPTVKAKSFTGALRKFKGEEVLGILKLEDDTYMVFIEE